MAAMFDRVEAPAPSVGWRGELYFTDRFAIPRVLTGKVWRGAVCIEVEVEVADGRARARRVSVSTDQARGVGSGTLRAVPVREAMVALLSLAIGRVEQDGDVLRIFHDDADVDARARVVRDLVGYVELKGGDVSLKVTGPSGETVWEEEEA